MVRSTSLILLALALGGCDLLIGHLLDRWPPIRSRQEEAMVPAPPPAPSFDPKAYRSVTDCLNAAAREHADLNLCTPVRARMRSK